LRHSVKQQDLGSGGDHRVTVRPCMTHPIPHDVAWAGPPPTVTVTSSTQAGKACLACPTGTPGPASACQVGRRSPARRPALPQAREDASPGTKTGTVTTVTCCQSRWTMRHPQPGSPSHHDAEWRDRTLSVTVAGEGLEDSEHPSQSLLPQTGP
jgi:hypothetical protein